MKMTALTAKQSQQLSLPAIPQPDREKNPNQQITATNDDEAFEAWLKTKTTRSVNTYDSYQRMVRRFYDWLQNTKGGMTLREVDGETMADYVLFLRTLDEQVKNNAGYATDIVSSWKEIRGKSSNLEDSDLPKHSFLRQPPSIAQKNKKRNNLNRTGQVMSARSVNYNFTVLAAFMRYLAAVGYLRFDPCATLPSMRHRKKQAERYLDYDEWAILYKTLRSLDDNGKENLKLKYARSRWLFSLGYLTGLRRSEIINASMADLIMSKGELVIKVWGKGRNKQDEHDFDSVYLPTDCVTALNEYRSSIGLGPHTGYGEDLPLVGRVEGNRNQKLSVSGIRKIFVETTDYLSEQLENDYPALARKIKEMTLHWLRHTGGSHMIRRGATIDMAQQWFRHDDVSTTLLYTHHESDKLRKAINTNVKLLD
ncbi:tyrosine-type recombinase/integrase [Iodobacter sp. CM08]|uniref:tyrosine-type recombinase/integrase n=1 Tax=Iodobacter sp. CM08 TaxID=3085902 RepID=UPI002980DDF0|nr:tyrosine-type recombinase/integrase [Iodobacter sp. CM08]MDW5418760.1 tyrosine-type recombinase/integrase [Iodobacter sp. CM08]